MELNKSKRVEVRNTTNTDTWFRSSHDKDVKIPKKSKKEIEISEIIHQCDDGNPDFVGYGRDGKHATFYIEDKEVRVYLGFETEKQKQEVIDEDAIVGMFEAANLKTFYSLLQSKVVTPGQKQTLREVIASGKVNAHDKMKLAESFLKNEKISDDALKGRPGRPKNS